MKPILPTKALALPLTALLALPFLSCDDDKGPPLAITPAATGGSSGSVGPDARAGGTGGSTGGAGGSSSPDAAAGTGGSAPSPDASPGTDARNVVAEIKCTGVTDKTTPIAPAAGRKVYCAIDLGSNNLKLQVLSLEPGKPLSFKDERQCRVRTGFGAMVSDPMTMVKSALKASEISNLILTMKEFQRICSLDTGVLVGAEATQWARDATNMPEVQAMVKAGTTLDIQVLSTDDEGKYGYVAATRNTPEKFSLDPGSNSFQIGWWPKGATAARTVSVAFGYVRGAENYYLASSTDTYDVARAKHAGDIKTRLDAELGKLMPPTSLAMLKAAIIAGNIKPEIFAVGQDGALHLAVKASLRDAMGKWIDDQKVYDDRVAMERPMVNAVFGDITTLLTPEDVNGFFTAVIQQADYDALRSEKVRKIYGEKVLANAVLLDMLVKELGLTSIVLVPQEMPAGYILASPLVN
jgi:hypothetical protein